MLIGVRLGTRPSVPDMVAEARECVGTGLDALWVSDNLPVDPLVAVAAVGAQVPGVPIGTAVVTTFARHPLTVAAQALTVRSAIGGDRLTLGVGPGHQHQVEGSYGLDFRSPARFMHDYLHVLGRLFRGDVVDHDGEYFTVRGQVAPAGSRPPRILLGALRPAMLRVAAEVADGALTVWSGPRTIAQQIAPALTAGGGTAAPQRDLVAYLPVCVGDERRLRELASKTFQRTMLVPTYRAIFEREGATGVGDVVIAGSQDAVAAQLGRLADAGATEFVGVPYGDHAEIGRTIRALGELSASVGAR